MRELWLLRHAKSAWNSDAPTDFERPLNKRGRSDAPRLGNWMKRRGLVPDGVFSSDAVRARQTAQRLLRGLAIESLKICYDHGLYLASRGDLVAFVQTLPSCFQRPLIIGHNPGLDELVEFLCGPRLPLTDDGKLMTTASLACIGVSGEWPDLQPGGGTLRELTRVRDLPAR